MNTERIIYFDNSASAMPNPNAVKAAVDTLNIYANPSSLHCFGLEARHLIDEARKNVANALCCTPNEVYFTSSGTEANNIALLSLAEKNKRNGNVIITEKTEHPSVSEVLKHLEKSGMKLIYAPVPNGQLDLDFVCNALKNEKVSLVTLMQANNENGAVNDLKKIREAIKQSGSNALFHSDCVQGFLKVDDNMRSYTSAYCDTASVSAHKIGGLKGTGCLFVRKGLTLQPVLFGGGQEKGLISGTENVFGIVAFGNAAKLFDGNYRSKITSLREMFITLAEQELGDGISFEIPEDHIDALVNISLKNVKSEVALNYLSSKGICVSASSACHSKAKTNPVLASFGYTEQYIISSLRIGFSPFNTEDEVRILVNELKNAASFRMRSSK